MHSFPVLKARSPKARRWRGCSASEGFSGGLLLAFSRLWWFLEFRVQPRLVETSLRSLPLSSHDLLLRVSASGCLAAFPLSYKDSSLRIFGQSHLEILNLIKPAKILFPSGVTFPDARFWDFGRGFEEIHNPSHYTDYSMFRVLLFKTEVLAECGDLSCWV